MDNVMKKFFAYNPDHFQNNPSNLTKTAKSSSVYNIPPQIQLLDQKSSSNQHSKFNYDQERIKTLEEKIIQIENKKNNEKNELFHLIKSNLNANRSHHNNNLPILYNTPNSHHLPNIRGSRSPSYWKFDPPSELPNKFKQKLEFGEKMEELRDSITQRLRVFRKLNVNEELKDELIEIKHQMKNREKFLENKNNEDLHIVVQEIKSINDIINRRIDEEYEKSKENANVLGRDFNMFKNEIVEKISNIQQRQQNQIKGLKFILNNSSVNKDKLIIDDLEDIDGDNRDLLGPIDNKDYEQHTKKESNNKGEGTVNEYRRVIAEIDLKSKPHDERLKAEIMLNRVDKEHTLKESIKERLKKHILEKNEGKEEKMKQIILKYRHIIKRKGARLKGLNLFRKVVYYYIAAFRLSKVPKSNKEFIRKESMKLFVANFENIDKEVKIWLYDAIRVPIQSILNYEYLNIDITQSGTIFNTEEEIKEIYSNLQIRIQAMLENLIEKTESKYISSNIIMLMDMITSKGNYIPRQFILLFEIARLDIENCVLGNVDDDQRKMILIFYIFIKTLVSYILIDHNFSENRQRKSSIYKNFKVCASIFYYTIRNYFKKFVIDKNEKDEKNEKQVKKPRMLDMTYYNTRKTLEKKLKREKENEEEIERKLNKYIKEKFQYFFPDTKRDICECIEGQLFPEEELNTYYELSRQNKFDLNKLIIKWVERLEDVIDENIKNKRDKEKFS